MKNILVYIALIVAGPQEEMYQALDEAGVKLGAYYGCYESANDGLVCVLPEQVEPEKVLDKEA